MSSSQSECLICGLTRRRLVVEAKNALCKAVVSCYISEFHPNAAGIPRTVLRHHGPARRPDERRAQSRRPQRREQHRRGRVPGLAEFDRDRVRGKERAGADRRPRICGHRAVEVRRPGESAEDRGRRLHGLQVPEGGEAERGPRAARRRGRRGLPGQRGRDGVHPLDIAVDAAEHLCRLQGPEENPGRLGVQGPNRAVRAAHSGSCYGPRKRAAGSPGKCG